MKRLDCESRTTALKSLADITGIDAERIWDVFLKYDYVSEYDNGRFPCDFLDFLYNSFMEHFEIQNVEIDEICWFHLTRTLHPKLFQTHGILPRKDAYLLLSQAECRTLNPCSPIFTKECQGPFAMLVKDIAFCPEDTDHHDYLRVPELMEDMGLSSIYEENGRKQAESTIKMADECYQRTDEIFKKHDELIDKLRKYLENLEVSEE